MIVSKHFNHIKRRAERGPSAAAIRYDEQAGEQPKLVAQGSGAVAEKIIELASKEGIPLEEDADLLSVLLDIDLGENVPPQLYSVMAEILLLIQEMESNY
ncbi:EscU/YscU/HrcU family type III secretion system export apparatus switch protein [Evansella sp. LMS18]|uniref:EscU/YscU/HrcU family type III secretion system export apparatus switch protein n=1 Tax=Evansella sp. LMS18 TaxID=2924033 RepID=UPI0020D020F2|nr:EscU/YscU/HrcU family type III secretion system export apparatus switch protein [Evansella sp. LMS18]UTR09508.1 EscU/YscU/HrcU family type III secretion system export apparatus switch protein [Evansella sp. LMS18]